MIVGGSSLCDEPSPDREGGSSPNTGLRGSLWQWHNSAHAPAIVARHRRAHDQHPCLRVGLGSNHRHAMIRAPTVREGHRRTPAFAVRIGNGPVAPTRQRSSSPAAAHTSRARACAWGSVLRFAYTSPPCPISVSILSDVRAAERKLRSGIPRSAAARDLARVESGLAMVERRGSRPAHHGASAGVRSLDVP